MYAQWQRALASNCLASVDKLDHFGLEPPWGKQSSIYCHCPTRSLSCFILYLPCARWKPFSAVKQHRRASEGKGKLINLPQLNQSFAVRTGSIGSVTYQSYC